jgi:hypothetical protein
MSWRAALLGIVGVPPTKAMRKTVPWFQGDRIADALVSPGGALYSMMTTTYP